MLIEQFVECDRGEVLGVEIAECFVEPYSLDEFGRRNAGRSEFEFYLLGFTLIVRGFGDATKVVFRAKVGSTLQRGSRGRLFRRVGHRRDSEQILVQAAHKTLEDYLRNALRECFDVHTLRKEFFLS